MWAGFEDGPARFPYRRPSIFAQHAHTPPPTPHPATRISGGFKLPPSASPSDAGPVCPLGGG
eukprot:3283532-Prymnesium_polylepis.1